MAQQAIPKTDTFYAKDRVAWRKWLQQHHDSSRGIWLVYFKKDSGKTRVPYADAVEEALCFGWIDSTLNPIDEHSYMQLFTPRKPKSGWSKLNKERIEQMVAQGLMTPAGQAKIDEAVANGTWNKLDGIESFTPSKELANAFAKNKKAKAFFDGLSNTNKKYILYYTSNAKSAVLKQKRIDDIIAAANEQKMIERFISRPKPKKDNNIE